jgi:hypothetical protein
LTDLPALQITGQHFENPELAVVTFRAPQFERDEKLNVKLTPAGRSFSERASLPTSRRSWACATPEQKLAERLGRSRLDSTARSYRRAAGATGRSCDFIR